MNRFLCVVLGLALATPSFAADKFDPIAAGKTLAPFVDAQTLAVVRVDLRPTEVGATVALAKRFGMTDIDVGPIQESITTAIKAGATRAYIVVSLDDLPTFPPFLVVTMSDAADEATVTRVLQSTQIGTVVKYDRVLVAAADSTHRRLKAAKPSARPDLDAALATAGDSPLHAMLIPTADHRKALSELVPQLPPQLGPQPGKAIARGITSASLSGDVLPQLAFKLSVKSENADAARSLAEMVKVGLQLLANQRDVKQFPGMEKLLGQLAAKVDGDRVNLSIDGDSANFVEVMGGAMTKARQAAARTRSMNNLKQIALAWHMHHDANRDRMPANSQSKDGKPLLSWRVQILPYLECESLYKQFKLNEPWDSEHNKKLIAQMPVIYMAPAQKAERGKTSYLAPFGQGGAKGEVKVGVTGVPFKEVVDGTSATIMIVEASDEAAVIWTKPDDLEVTEANPHKGLFGHFPDAFDAAFADGSVRSIRKSIDPKSLWAFFTRNGGEVTPRGE